MSLSLKPTEIAERLSDLPLWRHDAEGKTLCRDFVFGDFSQAFAFMARVALAAEKAGHHPDWSNSYNRVSIRLTTHSAGGISEKDFALAIEIDAIAAN